MPEETQSLAADKTHAKVAVATRSAAKESALKPDDPGGSPSYIFTWGDISLNECTIKGARMVIESDGTGAFSAQVYSPTAGEIWQMQGLALIDKNGIEMFRTPLLESGPIYAESAIYGPANIPGYVYPFVDHVIMYNYC